MEQVSSIPVRKRTLNLIKAWEKTPPEFRELVAEPHELCSEMPLSPEMREKARLLYRDIANLALTRTILFGVNEMARVGAAAHLLNRNGEPCEKTRSVPTVVQDPGALRRKLLARGGQAHVIDVNQR